jgi:hypothetical protein
MYFIGIITDKNSENNIKNIIKEDSDQKKLIFLNNKNIKNFKNIKFDSIIINNKMEDSYDLEKILEKSKYILYNSDININTKVISNAYSNIITYGYNTNATVTISSATDEYYLIFIQKNISGNNQNIGIQEINFERIRNNINAYDGMITTLINLIYE